ncbi:lysozyme [Serratia sp. JSRIV004]|uniref:lysozyme n=1 Tax=Serratia sp. JSRIV004 TaxID=2831895 RepID=UPI001CBFF492|nr:lysozyme [Serratia sp. JSRIV004]UAN55460.1 lysozyme [Serratia sp. JSRIV004]UAN57273.1 lysozyme [Serratia sp. JSRIV004]
MKISNNGLALIKAFEGLSLTAYPDPGTGGAPWTIGWGHTGPEVKPGLTWTQAQAKQALNDDVARFERDVRTLVKVEINQNQFDALVSFAFNVGSDIDEDDVPEGLGDSTLLRKLNAGDYEGAANEFVKWNNSAGKVMKGLTRRRAAERDLFLKPCR